MFWVYEKVKTVVGLGRVQHGKNGWAQSPIWNIHVPAHLLAN